MTRALLALAAAFAAAIATAQYAYRVASDPGDEPAFEAWAQNEMKIVAWNGTQWTAWIHDGKFEQAPAQGGRWSRHSKRSIVYLDWDGEPWQAKIDGSMFVLAHRGNWQQASERSGAIRYRDWSGSRQIRTVAELTR